MSRRSGIDLDAQLIDIRARRQSLYSGRQIVGPPKTEAGRRTLAIPCALIDDLRDQLDTYSQPNPDGYVFTGVKGPVTDLSRSPRR